MSHGRPGSGGCDWEPLSLLEGCLPPGFERRVISLAPGASRAFDEADWSDALVVLTYGEVDLEALSGCRVRLQPGAILWLTGLPLRCLHNTGQEPAVLVAVSRKLGGRAR